MAKFLLDILGTVRLGWRPLRDPSVPAWSKLIPIGTVLYLLFPLDLIPDVTVHIHGAFRSIGNNIVPQLVRAGKMPLVAVLLHRLAKVLDCKSEQFRHEVTVHSHKLNLTVLWN